MNKTLLEVFKEKATKKESKKVQDALKAQIEDTPEQVLELIKSVNTEIIRDNGKVTQATFEIKGLKTMIKYATESKTAAVKPWEERRKAANLAFTEAKEGKKAASDKYLEFIQAAKTKESQLRVNLSEFSTYLSRKEEEERQKQADLLEESRRKAEEQLEAQQEFLETDDSEKLAEMEQLGQESKAALRGAQEAEYQASVAPTEKVSGVTFRRDITFEVEDIDAVPDNYFTLTVDKPAVVAKLAKVFPGMEFNIQGISFDPTNALDEYLLEDIDESRILQDLKADKELTIPGIKKSFKEIPIVR